MSLGIMVVSSLALTWRLAHAMSRVPLVRDDASTGEQETESLRVVRASAIAGEDRAEGTRAD